MGAIAPRVHHALGDALMVEVEDLLAEMRIFDQRRAAVALPKGVLIVGNRHPLLRCQDILPVFGHLVGFAALAPDHSVIVIDRLRGSCRRFFCHNCTRQFFPARKNPRGAV